MSSTLCEAIIEAFEELGGTRTIAEIKKHVSDKHGTEKWKDFGTVMADMVSTQYGGNNSSDVPKQYRVLKRISRGLYAKV